jgi:hypothetical protein
MSEFQEAFSLNSFGDMILSRFLPVFFGGVSLCGLLEKIKQTPFDSLQRFPVFHFPSRIITWPAASRRLLKKIWPTVARFP